MLIDHSDQMSWPQLSTPECRTVVDHWWRNCTPRGIWRVTGIYKVYFNTTQWTRSKGQTCKQAMWAVPLDAGTLCLEMLDILKFVKDRSWNIGHVPERKDVWSPQSHHIPCMGVASGNPVSSRLMWVFTSPSWTLYWIISVIDFTLNSPNILS